MSYNLQKLIKVMNKKSQTIYNAIHNAICTKKKHNNCNRNIYIGILFAYVSMSRCKINLDMSLCISNFI